MVMLLGVVFTPKKGFLTFVPCAAGNGLGGGK